MFLDCAVHAGAQYLITGDEDLLILNRSGSCSIITPSEYLSVVHDL
jgi:predicted nucleic acid-binding protein